MKLFRFLKEISKDLLELILKIVACGVVLLLISTILAILVKFITLFIGFVVNNIFSLNFPNESLGLVIIMFLIIVYLLHFIIYGVIKYLKNKWKETD